VHFPKYWAKGTAARATVWRWSDDSLADAQQKASKRATELAAIFASGKQLDKYSYGDRPLREEIVQTLSADAVVTRNLYGALVVNAARVMFVDVDTGEDSSKEAERLDQLQGWADDHSDLGVRIYKTAAGFRALVTNRTFDPKSDEARALLEEAGSDPLYMKLCSVQQSFRARLTPKPWRIGMRPPRVRFPYDNPDEIRQWVKGYDAASREVSVCQFVEATGPSDVIAEAQPILELHDRVAVGDQPLA
jgi:hypothetical protein